MTEKGPGSRWRSGASPGNRGSAERVRLSHEQTRPTLRVALAFVVAAALAAAWGSTRWVGLHLFLAGAVVLAISGVSLMLTVTWSAAPAPPKRWVAAQRVCIAAGAAGVGLGGVAGVPVAAVAVAAIPYVAGLVLLAWLLVSTVRQGVERRFDAAVAAYVAALLAGVVGVGLGAYMAITTPSPLLRAAHATTNLLGLVGLVVGGTMPFFAATVGRTRMSPHAGAKRLAATVCWQVCMLALAVGSLLAGLGLPLVIGLGGYALGILVTLAWLPRPTGRQLRWAGPRLYALWVGGLWWAAAVAATAVDVAAGRGAFGGRWLLVLVVAGYAQILWGSLAYLLPMLRGGGGKRLGEGFATTRSWVGLVAANVAGASLALALPAVVPAAAVGVWVIDSAWRAAVVGTSRAARPAED